MGIATSAADLDGRTPDPGTTPSTTPGISVWGGGHHFSMRHLDHRPTFGSAVCAVTPGYGDPGERCACTSTGARCCEHRNAKDGLCEPCRRWCPIPPGQPLPS